MRTTLDLDDDLVKVAEAMAREQGTTVGQVISDLAKRTLQTAEPPSIRNGFQLFPAEPGISKIDLQGINELRDER